MKSIAALALGLGMFGSLELAGYCRDDKKEDKKVEVPKLEGKYKLVGGKKNNEAISDDSKKWEYTFTSDKMTIKGMDLTFVMGYKIDPKTTPMNVEFEILEGPDGIKGMKTSGIIEVKGDDVKLAYATEMGKEKEKDKRPKNFDGKEGHSFEFKKLK